MFLGIDSGGTKTQFLLTDEWGVICSKIECESSYYLQCGFDGVKKILLKGITTSLKQVNVSKNVLLGTCIGLSAFGEVEKDTQRLKKTIQEVMGKSPYILVNDVVIGWAGALGLSPGINIVSGTGSISYGVDEKKQSLRCGGWGHMIGDEGSAYWIGKQAIRYFTYQSDGRLHKTALYDYIKNHFSIKRDFDIVNIFRDLNRTEVASICPLVSIIAEQGDVIACKLFKNAAKELVIMAKCIVDTLSFQNHPIAVSGTGGVFKASKVLFPNLHKELKNIDCIFRHPILSPSQGAVLKAAVELGKKDKFQIMNNLQQSAIKNI